MFYGCVTGEVKESPQAGLGWDRRIVVGNGRLAGRGGGCRLVPYGPHERRYK